MPHVRIVNPPGMAPPRGYSNGVVARGALLAVAGQIGWDGSGRLVAPELLPQLERALMNVLSVVRGAGGAATDIVRLTIYVTDKREYLAAQKPIGEAYRRHLGRHFPAMALVEVSDLLEEGAKVEIEATAVLPERPGGGRR